MTRNLLEVPRTGVRIVDENGELLPEWQRQFEELFVIVQNMADQLDAATGSSSGATVDSEWNAFVNAVKQD